LCLQDIWADRQTDRQTGVIPIYPPHTHTEKRENMLVGYNYNTLLKYEYMK